MSEPADTWHRGRIPAYQTFADPTTFHTGSVAVKGRNAPVPIRVVPFMNHTEKIPVGVGLCHSRSARPSSLKSVFVDTSVYAGDVTCVFVYVIVPVTVVPVKFHADTCPVAELYSASSSSPSLFASTAARPKTPEDVVEMVKGGPISDETRAIRSSPRAVAKAPTGVAVEAPKDWKADRRVWAGAAGIAALLVIGVFMSNRPGADAPATGTQQAPAPPVAAPAIKARPSLVVLGITNATQDAESEALSIVISELLTHSLAIDGKLRVLPSQEALRAARELDLGTASPSPSQLAQLRSLLGANYVITGAASGLGSGDDRLVRLELNLVDLASGKTVAQSSTTGTATALPDLVARGSENARKFLALAPVTADQGAAISASWPATPDTSRLSAEGLSMLRRADFKGARTAFEKAVRLSPDHPVPHAGLASSLASLGYAGQAKEEAATALGLTDKLAPETRLWMNAQLQETSKDWKAAAQTYGALLALAPDNLDYGVRLAEAQSSGSMAKEALQTIQTLRTLPLPLSADPRLDLAVARAYQRLGDFKQQLAFATTAGQAATKTGARLVAANAKLVESNAQERLGDRAAAARACQEAQRLFEAAGDKSGSARALELVALGVYRGGDLDGANKLFERVLAMHTETGDSLGMSRARTNLAIIAYKQGAVAKSERLDAEALATLREIGAKGDVATTLNNIAIRLQNSGDLGGAQKKYKEALDVFTEISDRRRQATTLGNLAEVMAARGDLKNSEAMLNEGLATWRELGEQGEAAYVLARLGDLAAVRGDLIVARDRFDEALKIQQEMKERLAMAETKVSMARLALSAGKPSDAETLAREAEEVLRAEKSADSQLLAGVALAEAQLALNKTSEARETAKALAASAPQSSNANVRATYAILSARLQAAGGDVAGAVASLDKARQAAAKDNLLEQVLRTRLVAGQIEMTGGREKAGRARLLALAKEAEAGGFGLIGRLAKEAAK